MKTIILTTILLYSFISVYAINNNYIITYNNDSGSYRSMRLSIKDFAKQADGAIHLTIKTPISFTGFGIGWADLSKNSTKKDYSIKYRVKKDIGNWNYFQETDAFVEGEESKTGIFWTDILFGLDEYEHQYIDFYIYSQENTIIEEVQLYLIDLSNGINSDYEPNKVKYNLRDCPEFPDYIPRSSWCGGYAECHNPSYTIEYINPTHTIIHYGASPNTYTDGSAIIRSYWDYHVNNLGWWDIGYNYVTDKYGNLYEGRWNPNLPTEDVRAAHAGASNPYSIGVNFLGNTDITQPTQVQLATCHKLLAWWYNYYQLDPTSTANIVLQSGGTGNVHRISGHKDVNIGGTACPGIVLTSLLPSIRQETKKIIDDCLGSTDNIPPATAINIIGNVKDNWRGFDFNAKFTDEDNIGGSGINETFYQVLEYENNEWRANYLHGYFNDNFNSSLSNYWTILSGDWAINSGALIQTDQSLTNPNIYASLNQANSHTYLYHFKGLISGSGSDRRFGFYFFCSDASLSQRGDSYLAYFRADDNSFHLYKSTNNVISSPLVNNPVVINVDNWYDYKVSFNPQTGLIKAYVNNVLVASYLDSSPHQNGSYISLRTGGCVAQYDDFKAYKSRNNEIIVSVGDDVNNEVRFESLNSTQEACKILSIVNDVAGNWSDIAEQSTYIDYTAPISIIDSLDIWQSDNFQVSFNDEDVLSGIYNKYYQIVDFDGNEWRSNAANGYFKDALDTQINNEWVEKTGTWLIEAGSLVQIDESITNTNIYTSLNQNIASSYLYSFDINIGGQGANRRGGFHFFCDNAELENRGNSYFIWFRLDYQSLEIYKVTNNVFVQEKVVPFNILADTWYKVNISYNKVNGEINAYVNNQLVAEWKDVNPITGGNYISFRNGNSRMAVKNLNIYRNRLQQANVSLGSHSDDIRYQNVSPLLFAAEINSIVIDKALNVSYVYSKKIKIDWTKPDDITYINDGSGNDIDTVVTYSMLSANWAASADINSDIAAYWYCIGTSQGNNDVLDWTYNANLTYVTRGGLNLEDMQTYYFSVKAENGAGLFSNIISSNGQTALVVVSVNNNIINNDISLYPNPTDDIIYISFNKFLPSDISIDLINMNGKIIKSYTNPNFINNTYNISLKSLNLIDGQYIINILYNDKRLSLPFSFIR